MTWDELQVWCKYPVILLVGFGVTMVLTALWRRLAPTLGFMDIPGTRRLHAHPTPSAGGLAIFGGFHAACAAIYFVPWLPFSGQLSVHWWFDFFIVSLCVVVVGLIDDRFRLKPWTKLMGQIIVAGIAYYLGMQIGKLFGAPLPGIVDFVLTVGWFLVMMNAFNLIDGMDGLAAGLGIIAAMGVGVSLAFRHHPNDVMVCMALAGACAGFLRHNFYPAKVFMGDTGSMLIGCAIAALALGSSSKGMAMASVGVPILAVGVPILDAGLAVWRRSVRSWMQDTASAGTVKDIATADAEHLHHRLLRQGWSQRQVAVGLYMFGGILSALGVVSSVYREYALGVIMVTFLVGTYVVVRHLAWIELWDSGAAVMRRVKRRGPKNRAVLVYPLLDLMAMSVTLVLAFGLVAGEAGTIKSQWERAAPWAIGLPFLALIASRSYGRVWSMARVSEYALTGLAVIAGILLWMAGSVTFYGHGRTLMEVAFLYMGLAVPLVVGMRAFVRVVQDMMAWKSRFSAGKQQGRRVLLVGVGADCLLFLKEVSLLYDDTHRIIVVGMVDEDAALWGRWVHGYRVLGGLESLDAILKSTAADELVVFGKVEHSLIARIMDVARPRGLVVRQWTTSFRTLSESN